MVTDWYHTLIAVGDDAQQEGMVNKKCLYLSASCLINCKLVPYLVNRKSPVTGGSICHSGVIMVLTLGYEGSGIPVLKCFILAPVIRICGFPLYKYPYFKSLGNASWLNIVDLVVSAPIITVLGCLIV